MPLVTLTNPVQSYPLTKAMIAAIKFENNPFKGQDWTEIWVVFGYLTDSEDENTFTESVHPNTLEADYYVKLENGFHPLRSGMGLGKCGTCGKWHNMSNGACQVSDCDGIIEAYDGHDRLMIMGSVAIGESLSFHGLRVGYQFLLSEVIPDPDDLDVMIPILEGILE